jgi:heterodisulfide reductase subunit A
MVVLATGMMPSAGTTRMVEMLDLVSDEAGFIAPDHPLLRPSEASLEGVFVAGCASGPGDISGAVADAKAAVGGALARVQPGKKMVIAPLVAETLPDICSKCMICVSVCPFHAAQYDRERDAVAVSEVLCRGCGTCVPSCASGAARARQFTDDQLSAEIREVLHG